MADERDARQGLAMMDKPVDLDKHRGAADQKATEPRRQRLEDRQSDEDACVRREAELDDLHRLLANATTPCWLLNSSARVYQTEPG